MQDGVIAQIRALQRMTVGELQVRWRELYGEESKSRNREFLFRRLAWRVQELAHGGLSDRALARIAELAPDGFMRAVTPPTLATGIGTPENPEPVPMRTVRDPRLPSVGTVISRSWHGRELRLLVLENGYELDGVRYDSLSEAARAVTGAHWNGKLFWGVTQRTRRK